MTEKTPDIFAGDCPEVRVGLCQVASAPLEVERNYRNTLEQLEEAGRMGAQLAITPECVIHGYPDVTDAANVAALRREALEPGHERLKAIGELAGRHGMMVVVGFAERGRAEGVVHNSAAVFDPGGRLAQVYRKVFLRPFEDALHTGAYTAGEVFQVDELLVGDEAYTIGTMICFDREITESARCLRALGAQFLACPLACDTCDMRAPITYADAQTITRVRAAENEVFIAVVNHAERFNGGSFIVGPGGELVDQLGSAAEVRVVPVALGAVARKFHAEPLGWQGWGYRRPEVHRKYL